MGNTWRQPETRIDKKGDKGRQDFGKADTPSNTGTHVGTMGDNGRQSETRGGKGRQRGDKGRQDLGKVDTPANTKADTLRKH